ncbi:DinB family protein [Rhodonellum sp.]|uniref:DinB family protein n=1 Tax=Rhodonellum sp. TaxID=2231180 RepID=UPI00271D5DC9|nr:DinB family protein [Rhodonellum sp.]MDO9553871.1 DinB family protein [Rhodonellum sp.]
MNTKKTLLSIALFIGAVLFSYAQKSVDESIQDWERAKNYTKEYLDAMPESGYSLKPTPEIRSFAEVMLHLTDANYGFTAGALSIESPVAFGESDKTEDISKENVTKLVLAGYDFVIANLKKVTVDQLNEKTTLFGSFEMPKRTAFDKLFEHQTHHRGQTTLYLRLAGVVPPNEKLF